MCQGPGHASVQLFAWSTDAGLGWVTPQVEHKIQSANGPLELRLHKVRVWARHWVGARQGPSAVGSCCCAAARCRMHARRPADPQTLTLWSKCPGLCIFTNCQTILPQHTTLLRYTTLWRADSRAP